MARKKDKLVNPEVIKDKIEELKEKIDELEGNFEEKIEEHPLASLGIALGVGAIIGAVATALIKKR